ncbi:RolB family protein [Microvirga tunisiensis]
MLEDLLERVHVQNYSEFCDRVLAAQASFVNAPGAPWMGRARQLDFLQVPLMDEITANNYKNGPFESIHQGGSFLYLYLPAGVARMCLQQQSLAPIPNRLRVQTGGGLLAMDAWPYDQYGITAEQVVRIYHKYGCRDATVQDVEFFVAVPRTASFGSVRGDTGVSIRRAPFDRFDIPVIGPALYLN